MPELTMVQALNAALRRALAEDERVVVFGEDVGRLGGVFRVTQGLQAEFGERRVFDTPIAESGIAGLAVGLALRGFRPVAELQFDAFSYPALNQVISHLAKYRNRTRGACPMPVVVRIPVGGGIGAAESHSDSPEAYYAHTAGLKVAVPSSPGDAYHLLLLAVRDPDPVIFLEPKARYWAREEVAEEDGLPFGRCRVLREGEHCTLLSWGAMVARCLEAAEAAAEDGASLQVVDLRTLVPLDVEGIVACVRRTGRAVVVHEAPLTGGFGAEVVARIVEHAFDDLKAPPQRVAGYDIPYPTSTLERWYLPSVERILRAVARTFGQ